jgi:hypothetical protein
MVPTRDRRLGARQWRGRASRGHVDAKDLPAIADWTLDGGGVVSELSKTVALLAIVGRDFDGGAHAHMDAGSQ